MLNYNHLFYFHIVASEGSVARAAERLGVTQPTISEQVRALERAIGITLFDRTPSGLKLTDEGRLAYEHTSVMFRYGERLIEALGQTPAMPRTLRVGLSAAVARSTSAGFLSPLFALADCTPSVRTADAAELLRDLRGSELDLVLTETEPPEPTRAGIEIVTLDRPKLVAVAQPTVVPSASWENVSVVHYRPSSAFHWDVEGFLDQHKLRPRIAAEADDALLLLEAACRGGFVAFVPRSLARDSVAAGRLRVVEALPAGSAAVHALYRDSASADLARRAIEVLLDAVHADAAD
ncbi:MAG TPA: LysR family transcriptional regulator [Kofleriaceae bacterium]|nr:LysR family transcriptional regulator [Kofleriaceae bacterium]